MLRKSLADSKTTDLSQARNTALQYNPLEKTNELFTFVVFLYQKFYSPFQITSVVYVCYQIKYFWWWVSLTAWREIDFELFIRQQV